MYYPMSSVSSTASHLQKTGMGTTTPSPAAGVVNQGHRLKPVGDRVTFSGWVSTQKASIGKREKDGLYHPLTAKELKLILNDDSTPYIGELPASIQKKLGLKEEQLFLELDKLANHLRSQVTTDKSRLAVFLEKFTSCSPKLPCQGLN